MDYVGAFLDFMMQHGMNPGHVIADGRMHRFHSGSSKKSKDEGWYKLTIEGNYAWGVFGDWALGIKKPWVSKSRATFTDAERILWEQRRQQMRALEAQKKRDAGDRAGRIWNISQRLAQHDYIDRKLITPFAARFFKDAVAVPVYKGGILSTLQFIKPDGSKKFLKDGDWVGGYCPIGRPYGKILLCEGYSTGCSLHMATGIAVAIAFNSTNLLPVADALRKKFPDMQIRICADNDQWVKRPNGDAWNPGIEAALEAGKAISADVIWPHFEYGDARRPTDFNDLHVLDGLAEVHSSILGQASQLQPKKTGEYDALNLQSVSAAGRPA